MDSARIIRLCAAAGYRVIDFSFHDLTTYDSPFLTEEWQGYIEGVKSVVQQTGVTISQAHAPVYDFCNPQVDSEYQDELLRRTIIASEMFGVRWLVMHPSTMPDTARIVQASREKNIRFFTRWVDFAAKHHVGIAVENMWDLNIRPKRLYCDNVDELIDLVDSVPDLGVCWDLEHGEIMQQDLASALEAIGDRLKVTHVSDYTDADNIHLLPYLGVIDWPKLMRTLALSSYSGDFNYELQHYLRTMPESLVPLALKLSVDVGESLIAEYDAARGELDE